MPEELWEIFEPMLPEEPSKPKGGRPRKPDREIADALFYLLVTGIQWNALPRCLGASSTVHDRFQEWAKAGVFVKLWRFLLLMLAQIGGLDWENQAMDGAMNKAPLGGEGTGPNPTDRRKLGSKRSLLIDGNGIPLAVSVHEANRHDMKLVEVTLLELVITSGDSTTRKPKMILDKGYNYEEAKEIFRVWGYIPLICSSGKESEEDSEGPGYRAMRWIVERTHAWLNNFRRILIRWEKKYENYLAMVDFACALIAFKSIFNS